MFRKLRSKLSHLFIGTTDPLPMLPVGWPPGEIKHGQEESYIAWLRNVVHNHDFIIPQLDDCATHDLVRKFKLICDVMDETEKGLDLTVHDPGSCFIMAVANNSTGVCEAILSLASRAQLMFVVRSPPDCKGCTALHLIAANEMPDMLKKYMDRLDEVDRLVMLNTHIEGKHFLKKMKVSSLPLHLACCSGNEEIFSLMLSYGAELDARDMRGNTVVHVLVELGKEDPGLAKQMMKIVLSSEASRRWYSQKNEQDPKHWTAQDDVGLKRHMLFIENSDGYTPLTWAANIVNKDMLEFILNIEGVHRHSVWRFGRSSFVNYDMREIDPIISHRQRPGKPNVLELLTYRVVTRGVVSCFSIPAIEHLINYKWKHQAHNFFIWAAWHLALMVICYQFPVIIIQNLEPSAMTNSTNSTNSTNTTNTANSTDTYNKATAAFDLVRTSLTLQILVGFIGISLITNLTCEVSEWARGIIKFITVLTRRWHGRSYKAPFTVTFKADTYRIVFTIFGASQILSTINLLFYSTVTSYTALAFITGCYFFMFFLQGFQMTSYFGTLMHLVIFTDMISFALVFVIMLVGFGGTMMMVIYDPLRQISGFENLQDATYTMFQLMTGLGGIDDTTYARNGQIVTAVFVLFVCLTIILLLNMLIAAMSETYAKLAQYRQEIWIRNRASMMIMFEGFSFVLAVRIRKGKYLTYDKDDDKYTLFVQTSVPATC